MGSPAPSVPQRPQPRAVFLPELEEGLQLHYTFEDRVGSTITDISGNGRHGTLQAGGFVSAPWGEAVSFDGVDDYVTLTGALRDSDLYGGTSGAMTMHARVRVDDTEHLNTLCLHCGPWNVTYIGADTLGPRVLSGVYDEDAMTTVWPSSTQALQDDTWVDVTMVVEGGVGVRYYLDCELDSTILDEDIVLHDFGPSSALGAGTASWRWFDGEIDDFRIWNRALSDEEILLACARPTDELCSGAPEGPSLVDPPSPPTSYTLPDDCDDQQNPSTVACVTDAAELQTAVQAGYADIILRDGLYEHGDLSFVANPPQNGDWLRIRGQRLWAETVGGAVLDFGIYTGGINGTYTFTGAEIHGLSFDVDDPDHVPVFSGEIDLRTAFLSGQDANDPVVEDTTFDGNGVLDVAIYARAPALESVTINRVVVDHFKKYGIIAGDGDTTPLANPMQIHDVSVRRIGDPDCHNEPDENPACPGATESGLFLAEPADVDRAFIRDVRRAGITTADETVGTRLANIDVDRAGIGDTEAPGVGVYFEVFTEDTILESFCVGPFTEIGVNSEPDQCPGQYCFGPRGISNVVRNGLIESKKVGVGGGQGTADFTIHDVTFRNYTQAGVLLYNNLTNESLWPNYDHGGTQYANTFEETEVEGQTCNFTRSIYGAQTLDCIPDLEAGLELHYTFQDRGGATITDMSGNARHGTLQDGGFVSALWGEAVSFDGVDDHLTLTGALRDLDLYGGASGAMTMHARVRVDDAERLNTLCLHCGPWNITYVGADTLGARVLSGVYDEDAMTTVWPSSTQALQDDTWVHVTMVIEGGVGVRYYLDCELDSTIPDEDILLHDFGPSSSLGYGTASWRWFEGDIDDFKIWSRALSDDEVGHLCTEQVH